jgi:hypothetical protein
VGCPRRLVCADMSYRIMCCIMCCVVVIAIQQTDDRSGMRAMCMSEEESRRVCLLLSLQIGNVVWVCAWAGHTMSMYVTYCTVAVYTRVCACVCVARSSVIHDVQLGLAPTPSSSTTTSMSTNKKTVIIMICTHVHVERVVGVQRTICTRIACKNDDNQRVSRVSPRVESI